MSGGRMRLSDRRCLQPRTKSEAESGDEYVRDVMSQTSHSESLAASLEKFENDALIVAAMKNYLYADALKLIRNLMVLKKLTPEENFKYSALKIECFLHLFMFIEAREDGQILAETCANVLLSNEFDIADVAYKCRGNGEFVRALLYYQCALQCWVREMRDGKIKKRSIEVINRGEKFALVAYHLGLSTDSKGMVYEYALPIFRDFIHQYEDGPEKLSVHRDLAIMGCCYYMGVTLKNLNDNEGSIEFTTHGINIGMKSLKEHKNYLLAKSHFLVAQCYTDLKDIEKAENWHNLALKLCPFIENWNFQSGTEIKEEFEKEVRECLKKLKKLPEYAECK